MINKPNIDHFKKLTPEYFTPMIKSSIEQVIGFYTENELNFEIVKNPETRFIDPGNYIVSRMEIECSQITYEISILIHLDMIKSVMTSMLGQAIEDIPVQAMEDVSGEVLNQVGGIIVEQMNLSGILKFSMGLTYPHTFKANIGTLPRRMWVFRDSFNGESYFELHVKESAKEESA